jgi:hypothetical protein
MVQFDKEASQNAPIRSLALSQGRLFTAQKTLVQDDKQLTYTAI